MANKIELKYEFIQGSDEVEEIVEGTWKDQGKFQTQENIIKYQDKFYRYSIERSGNYWNGYEFSHGFSSLYPSTMIELTEVHKVLKTVYVWESV